MKISSLTKDMGLVPLGAVSVIAAGGFLAESAPLARLVRTRFMRSLGEPRSTVCILLSHEQRSAFAAGFPEETRYLGLRGIHCYRIDGAGGLAPESWINGCNAWVDLAAARNAQLTAGSQLTQGEPIDSSWRCRMVWALVAEAARLTTRAQATR